MTYVLLVEGLEGLGVDEVVELDRLVGAASAFRGGLLLRLSLRLDRLLGLVFRGLQLGLRWGGGNGKEGKSLGTYDM